MPAVRCREMPQLDTLWRQVHGSGVEFVGINTKDTGAKAQAFVHDNKIGYPIVVDENGKTLLQLGRGVPSLLPSTVLIDKHGRVAAVYPDKLTAADLRPVLDSLRAES